MTDHAERLEALYREVGPKMWRAILAFASDPDIASDAVAEAFMQALARGGAIERPEAWLWRAAFRIAGGELARRNRPVPILAERSYEMAAPADHLLEALRRLPANQRTAVLMHDYADRPTSEVAEVLGITRGTVHVHLSRGRRRLRLLLEDDDD